MQEHPLIELYLDLGDDQQHAFMEQQLASVDIDAIAGQTLKAAGIAVPVMLTLLITNDENVREMNKQFRAQDRPTDVLSFPLLEHPLVKAPTDQLWQAPEAQQPTPQFITPPELIMNLGDIVMSWSTIARQANEAGHSPLVELLYLLSHGVLHLIGYDDQTEAGYQAMVAIQQSVLRNLGIG